MASKSINITLPEEILRDLANFTEDRERSSFIADCLREKLKNIRKERLRKELEDDYKEDPLEIYTVHNEFEHSDIEALRFIDEH